MTAEEEITFSKLDDGTNVITVKGKNFHGDTYLRQDILKESSVYDALKRKVEASKELVGAFIDVFDKASCIQHWHDTLYNKETDECEGMVVSADKVRELWEVLGKYRYLRHSEALENHLK